MNRDREIIIDKQTFITSNKGVVFPQSSNLTDEDYNSIVSWLDKRIGMYSFELQTIMKQGYQCIYIVRDQGNLYLSGISKDQGHFKVIM